MEGLQEIIATLERKTAANVPKDSADYIENGLLYCGKCHTPKEFRGSFLGMVKVVPCLCRCRSENWRQKNSSAKLKSGRRVSGSIAVLAFLKAICSIGTLQLMMVRTRA